MQPLVLIAGFMWSSVAIMTQHDLLAALCLGWSVALYAALRAPRSRWR